MRISKSELEMTIIVFVFIVFIFSFMDTINALNGKAFLHIFEDKMGRGWSPYMLHISAAFYFLYFSTMGFLMIKGRGKK